MSQHNKQTNISSISKNTSTHLSRFQDDCRALRVVVHRLSELYGVNIGQMLVPFAFSVDSVATHAHMTALCRGHEAPTIRSSLT